MMIVGVLGLGYVGLPLCREFVRGGCEVIGFDIDQAKIEQLQKSKSYIKHTLMSISENDLKWAFFCNVRYGDARAT